MSLFIYRIAQVWSLLLIKMIGCDLTVSGRENIPRSGGVCFVSNHVGIFDIALLLAYCGRPIGFVAKKELMLIPLFNVWITLIGGLYIDRGNLRKAHRTIEKGVARIKAGGGMIIFPEGHRSRDRGL
jgi:1-acyl-sn-glycerol-3-phosphate acyltransferase